jgi:cysteine desulfurase
MARLARMRDRLEQEIVSAFPGVFVNGDLANRVPHLLSVSFDAARYPMEGEMLVTNLDLEGISVSSGSACTSGSVQPSHVLLAMGRDEATARATLRFSFGSMNTDDDVPAVTNVLKRVLGRMVSAR